MQSTNTMKQENTDTIQVCVNRAYHVKELDIIKWERGELSFEANKKNVKPRIFGRSGDGFNVIFK